MNRRVSTVIVAACMAVGASSALAIPPAKVALKGARIIPVVGDDIAVGTLLIENGRITAIGEKVDVPYDAMVVDVSGKVLMPGMIDAHSSRGLDVPNENLPVTPFLDVYDAIDPSKLYFEDALRDGVTSVHVVVGNNCVIGSVSRVVHPIGLTPDEMTLQPAAALKFSVAPKRGWDRMAQMATFRETFRELDEYLENLAEKKYEESVEKKDEKIDVGPDEARKRGRELIKTEDYDDEHRILVKLTRGAFGAIIYAGVASDVSRAVALAGDHGFADRSTFVVGPDCYKAVDELKATGRPVVLDSELLYRERDPVSGDVKETFVPKVYADAGVEFSLLPSSDNSLAERYLNYQAARCVRYGLSRKLALESITINPARAIGVADRVGSLEVGKIANVVVMSGDPLDFNSWVESVYINGISAYDRDKDVRLKQLLGEEPADVAAESTDSSEDESPAEAPKPDGSAAEEKAEGADKAPADKSSSDKAP